VKKAVMTGGRPLTY